MIGSKPQSSALGMNPPPKGNGQMQPFPLAMQPNGGTMTTPPAGAQNMSPPGGFGQNPWGALITPPSPPPGSITPGPGLGLGFGGSTPAQQPQSGLAGLLGGLGSNAGFYTPHNNLPGLPGLGALGPILQAIMGGQTGRQTQPVATQAPPQHPVGQPMPGRISPHLPWGMQFGGRGVGPEMM